MGELIKFFIFHRKQEMSKNILKMKKVNKKNMNQVLASITLEMSRVHRTKGKGTVLQLTKFFRGCELTMLKPLCVCWSGTVPWRMVGAQTVPAEMEGDG